MLVNKVHTVAQVLVIHEIYGLSFSITAGIYEHNNATVSEEDEMKNKSLSLKKDSKCLKIFVPHESIEA